MLSRPQATKVNVTGVTPNRDASHGALDHRQVNFAAVTVADEVFNQLAR